jgi:hypothetical protein
MQTIKMRLFGRFGGVMQDETDLEILRGGKWAWLRDLTVLTCFCVFASCNGVLLKTW